MPAQRSEHRADNQLVYPLQGLHLLPRIAQVAGFVRCFNVYRDQVVLVQCPYGGLAFAGVVRIDVARGARHLDQLHAHHHGQTAENVHAGDDRPVNAERSRTA